MAEIGEVRWNQVRGGRVASMLTALKPTGFRYAQEIGVLVGRTENGLRCLRVYMPAVAVDVI